jgi:hypothetical protein
MLPPQGHTIDDRNVLPWGRNPVRVLLAMRRALDARPLLERAVTIYETKEADRGDKGTTRFALAQALWLTGGDRDRALDLARRAREDYAARGPLRAKELVRVEGWLGARSRAR